MNFLIGAGVVGIVFLLMNKMKTGAPAAGNINLPTGGVPFAPGGPPGLRNPTSTLVAERAGQALTAATGIPGFDKAGKGISQMFGKGRTEANDLVQHYQNPLVYIYYAQIVDSWNQAVTNGTATNAIREQVKTLIKTAASQFYQEAQRFPRAGPGGIQTIREFVDTKLIPGIDAVPLTR